MEAEASTATMTAKSPTPPTLATLPTTPPTADAGHSRARTVAVHVGKVILRVLVAYYVFCLVLLGLLRFVAPPTTAVQLQRRVEAFVTRRPFHIEKRFVPYSRLPSAVGRAVIVAEDGRFWRHHGFDVEEMRDAASDVLEGDVPRGASTLTQQLVKNLFGCACRNPMRKIYDWTLTPPAELILGKERILELYLNTVEWGPGVFGVDAAARHHYGVNAPDLTRAQSASLAALLPNPLRRTPENTVKYRAEILRRMEYRGW